MITWLLLPSARNHSGQTVRYLNSTEFCRSHHSKFVNPVTLISLFQCTSFWHLCKKGRTGQYRQDKEFFFFLAHSAVLQFFTLISPTSTELLLLCLLLTSVLQQKEDCSVYFMLNSGCVRNAIYIFFLLNDQCVLQCQLYHGLFFFQFPLHLPATLIGPLYFPACIYSHTIMWQQHNTKNLANTNQELKLMSTCNIRIGKKSELSDFDHVMVAGAKEPAKLSYCRNWNFHVQVSRDYTECFEKEQNIQWTAVLGVENVRREWPDWFKLALKLL